MAPLPLQLRRRLTSARPFALPSGAGKTIALMTVVELAQQIESERGLAIAPPPRQPIATILASMHSKVAGLDAVAQLLFARRGEVDEGDALDLRNELVEDLA